MSIIDAVADWLGEFEQVVLFAVLQLGDEAYGVTVRTEIKHRTGRTVSAGAVYTTLERLEARRLVVSRWGEPTPERGGKRKRYFKITAAGRGALARSYQAVQAMARGARTRLGEP